MTTPLEKPIRRELRLGDQVYTVTISALGVRIVPKGRRLGQEIAWSDLIEGGPQLTAQLRHSLDRTPQAADPEPELESRPRARRTSRR